MVSTASWRRATCSGKKSRNPEGGAVGIGMAARVAKSAEGAETSPRPCYNPSMRPPRAVLPIALLLCGAAAAGPDSARMRGLRRSLESFAERLDGAVPGSQDLEALSLVMRARVAQLRAEAAADPAAAGVLERLDA